MSTEPTGPWADAMMRVRATDPRNGYPSWNRLGEMAGVSTTTITMMASGQRKPSVATVTKVADALRVSPDEVMSWLPGGSRPLTPYEVPEEVHLLTPRQQRALTELIRAIAAEQEGGGHGGDTAATSEAPHGGVTYHGTGSGKTFGIVAELDGQQRAARTVRKTSKGQGARAAQDQDAEAPQ